MSPFALQLTRKPTPGRRPLICIPGTYCSPEVFELIDMAAFPELDLLPLSWMTSPGPWNIPALGKRVAMLLRELDQGPAILVGHSTGGAIALMAALTDPSLVCGLLIADTGANTRGHGDITGIIKVLENGVNPTFFQQLLQRSFYHQPDTALIENLENYAAGVPVEAALEVLKSQSTLDLSDELPKITMPVMVVHGRYDQARPIEHAEFLVKHLPHAELRLFDTGHTPMVEAVPEYEKALRHLLTMINIF